MMVELLSLACLAGAGFLVYAVADHFRRLSDEAEKRALNRQLAIQAEYLSQLEKQIDEGRRLRHDYRQHARMISELACGGNIEELQRYVRSADKLYARPVCAPMTANAEIDALLQHYRKCVSASTVDFKTNLALPKNLGIPSTDLGIILGNLLENAVDAALACADDSHSNAAQPYISVGGQVRAGMVVLAIDNTYTGDVWEAGGRFASTKHKGPGLGISSAKQAVESRGGIFSITYEENVFRVLVGIPLAQPVGQTAKCDAAGRRELATLPH